MSEKYRLRLEVVADTEGGINIGMEEASSALDRGDTRLDRTTISAEGESAVSLTLKHGVPDSVAETVSNYYWGRRRSGYYADALQQSLDNFKYQGMRVPEHLHDGLIRYVTEGQGVGDFLTACLENSLSEAVSNADSQSIVAIPAVSAWLYNNVPSVCYGSYDDMQIWQEAHYLARSR